jgi:hypothetical protein
MHNSESRGLRATHPLGHLSTTSNNKDPTAIASAIPVILWTQLKSPFTVEIIQYNPLTAINGHV